MTRGVAPSPLRPSPFDRAGQLLAIIALATPIYGLIHGGSAGFRSPPVILSLMIVAAGTVGFLWAQARSRHPMMPLILFRPTGMRIALSVGFAFMAGWFGTVLLVSLYLQQHLGLAPLCAGLVFLPAAVFSAAGNAMSGQLTNRFGPRVPVAAGLLSMVVGLVALVATAPLGSPLLTAILLIFIGPGGAVAVPP